MTLRHLLAGAAMVASLAAFATARAANVTVLGTEDPVNGFTGDMFPNFGYLVASDGESEFRPFGATFDVSDGLNFSGVNHVWNQAGDSVWTNIGSQTWVLPATTSCGSENEPECEPVGHFVSPDPWSLGVLGTYEILEGGPNGGGISDLIVLSNTDAGADLKFFSDPINVPEPATWAIMLVGLGGLGVALRAARSSKAAVVA
jgi:hypothetical protein